MGCYNLNLWAVTVKAAAAAPLQPFSITNRQSHRHQKSGRNRILSTEWRWGRSKETIHSMPPLLQRPQLLPTPPNTINSEPLPRPSRQNDNKEEEDPGDLSSAADVLRLMDSLQLPVESHMYASLLKECADSGDAAQGAAVHAHIKQHHRKKRKRSSCITLADNLLLMYAACGQTDTACHLFDRMPIRDKDVISWATVLATLADSGSYREAVQVFLEMHAQNEFGWLVSSPVAGASLVFTVMLWLCVQLGDLGLGQQVHGLIIKMAVAAEVGGPLIQFYALLDWQESAWKLFDRMAPPCRDDATWTCIISMYSRQGRFQEAFHVFREMKVAQAIGNRRQRMSSHAFVSILMGVGDEEGLIMVGRQVHADIVKVGMASDRFVGSSLVDMYARCGLLGDARRAFEAIGSARDTACWNAMLHGYLRKGCNVEAIRFLYEMKAAGIEPEESMLWKVRMACSS